MKVTAPPGISEPPSAVTFAVKMTDAPNEVVPKFELSAVDVPVTTGTIGNELTAAIRVEGRNGAGVAQRHQAVHLRDRAQQVVVVDVVAVHAGVEQVGVAVDHGGDRRRIAPVERSSSCVTISRLLFCFAHWR
jgi:hypothetical protein